ncbi:MAG: hypothetical protein AAF236_01635, partial [Verrucomicrobiota bacterium]
MSPTIKLPAEFVPVHCKHLKRFGCDDDGGYLIDSRSLEEADIVLSLGINDNWTFEEAVTATYRLPLHCYDPTTSFRLIFHRWFKALGRVFSDISHLKGRWARLTQLTSAMLSYKSFSTKHATFHREWVASSENDSVSFQDCLDRIDQQDRVFVKIDIEGSEYALLNCLLSNQNRFTG